MDFNPVDVVINEWSSQPRNGWNNTPVFGVQVIHKPTGAMVQVDTERSQHKNRAMAMKMLEEKVKAIQAERHGLPIPSSTPPMPPVATPKQDLYVQGTSDYTTVGINSTLACNMVFCGPNNVEVGKLSWDNNQLVFSGNVFDSAKKFIKTVNLLFEGRLDDAKQLGHKAGEEKASATFLDTLADHQQRIVYLEEALTWALEWIDAVPQDTVLPGMPGFNREAVDNLLKDNSLSTRYPPPNLKG